MPTPLLLISFVVSNILIAGQCSLKSDYTKNGLREVLRVWAVARAPDG